MVTVANLSVAWPPGFKDMMTYLQAFVFLELNFFVQPECLASLDHLARWRRRDGRTRRARAHRPHRGWTRARASAQVRR